MFAIRTRQQISQLPSRAKPDFFLCARALEITLRKPTHCFLGFITFSLYLCGSLLFNSGSLLFNRVLRYYCIRVSVASS